MSRRLAIPTLIFALFAYGLPATADSGLWLHVRVDEGDATKISVSVPFALIATALPMIDIGGHVRDGSIHIDDHPLSFAEMRDLWREVRDGPDMALVSVEERGGSMRLWKQEGVFHLRARDEDRERVDVRMPIAVVDALLGADGSFDFEAAAAALAEQGEGELVAIEGNGESVRVWVDGDPESTR